MTAREHAKALLAKPTTAAQVHEARTIIRELLDVPPSLLASQELQDRFAERVADQAIGKGGEIDAVRAAFKLATTVECAYGPRRERDVMGALNAYWRAVGVEP